MRANDIHPAMFPEELASRVIRLYTDPGDIVLDPFIGSGTTAIAALNAGRRFVGFDIMDKYARLAIANIDKLHQESKTPVPTQNSPVKAYSATAATRFADNEAPYK